MKYTFGADRKLKRRYTNFGQLNLVRTDLETQPPHTESTLSRKFLLIVPDLPLGTTMGQTQSSESDVQAGSRGSSYPTSRIGYPTAQEPLRLEIHSEFAWISSEADVMHSRVVKRV